MLQQELLIKVVKVLDANDIDYMITGSIASSIQGEPRLTHDIDIVTVAIPSDKASSLKHAFPESDYYLDEQSILEASRTQSMFNLIEMASGNKVDFWMLTEEPFDQSRFARKYTLDIKDVALKLCRPEDTILVKLRWAKLSGGSEKHVVDALRVYELQHDNLDLDYVESWVVQLGVQELWKQVISRSELL